MPKTIRTAVVGFGLAGKVFHAPFISAIPGMELSGILQRSGDSATQKYPHTHIYRTLESLLATKTDLLVIGTPNATHFSFAKAAILAGKHVVVDKPVTATSEEAAELTHLAEKHGVVYAPFHNRRWDGDFLTAKQLIDAGNLGRIVTFESHFDRFRPSPRVNSWKEDAGDLQSLVMDLGPHLVDQALALFGRPDSVTANLRTERAGSQIEDAFDLTLHYTKDGFPIRAVLRCTMIAAEPAPRFLVHGTQGSFRKYGVDPQEPAILAGAIVPPLEDTSWLQEEASLYGTVAAPDPASPTTITRTSVPTVRSDYRNFYVNVRDTILGTSSLLVTPRDAVHCLRILELARESSRQQRTLPVQDTDWL